MDARLMVACAGDADRFPTLSSAGRRILAFMREHPHAPIYRNHSGNRLLAGEVEQVRAFEHEVGEAVVGWQPGTLPAWMQPFIDQVFAQVPHYRRQGPPPETFEAIAPVSRADLAEDVTRFVPDGLPLDRLLNFRTTGTTGHPLQVPSHPVVAARYLAFHKRALRRAGVELRHGAGQVGVVLLGHQQRCFTYVSVTPTMDESGLAKLNLHPNDWRDPADRAPYLEALDPEVVAGDPISFTELLTLPTTLRPRALMSVSMTLMPGLRAALEARFGCPVLDIYSLNEVGPVAAWDARAGGHVLLQPRLYVELLGPDGKPVAPGARGEITVTGGFNDWLPLLRYRTGDHASLAFGPDGPVLIDLCGRDPVRYRTLQGRWINNIEISHALAPLPIAHYAFHQCADGALELLLAPAAMGMAPQATRLLAALFGDQPVAVKLLTAEDKVRQYTSSLAGALA
ncbi:MAG: capsule biosynthesis protein CapK [Gammaproteobacteria bacterium]